MPAQALVADRRIGQIALDELHGFKAGKIRSLASDEAIDASDRIAAFEQRGCNRASYESRGSGDKILGQACTPKERILCSPISSPCTG